MSNKLFRKGLIIWIIFLFLCVSVLPIMHGSDIKDNQNELPLITEQGLICCWDFNEGIGNIAHDTSGYENDGTLIGANWVNGILGSALEITDQEYIGDIPSSFDDPITSAFTVTAWVKWYGPTTNPWNYLIFDGRANRPNGFYFAIHPDTGQLIIFLNQENSEIYSASSVHIRSWTFVVCVFNDETNTIHLYINGVQDKTATTYFQWQESYHPAMIGNNHWAPYDGQWASFNGIEDEICLYNRELSEDEIWNQYIALAPPNLEIGPITGGFGIKTSVKNTGTNATNVKWTIILDRGVIILGKSSAGNIPYLATATEEKIKARFIFGLGRTNIIVSAICNGGENTEKNASAFVIGPLILGVT